MLIKPSAACARYRLRITKAGMVGVDVIETRKLVHLLKIAVEDPASQTSYSADQVVDIETKRERTRALSIGSMGGLCDSRGLVPVTVLPVLLAGIWRSACCH